MTKKNPGRVPLEKEEKRNIRIVTYVSDLDIANDNGISRYLKAMNRVMDAKIKTRKTKKS
ncbi:MAG: hypothetical protein KGI54_18395 [Pseudomonadota bacterium]|nr:hypothetical protein [Pseudomonadota bacterium]